MLFRHLPIKVRGTGGENQSHSTVQAEIEYDFSLFSDGDELPEDGAVLPFVTFPCKETDVIKKEIYSIISQMGESRDKNSFSASLSFVNIIQILNKAARKRITTPRTVLSYKIKNYISDHIDSSAITLAELAIHLNKTPNYINFVFKKENGTTINQYISCEKMKKVAQFESPTATVCSKNIWAQHRKNL